MSDAVWLEDLAAAHGARLLGYLARRLPAADAADVYQAVLEVAWRKPHQIPPDADGALAWLMVTARYCVANHRRAAGRRLAATDRLRQALHAGRQSDGVGRAGPTSVDDRVDEVRAALAALSSGDRELVTLVYWDGFSIEQAAVILDLPPATARKRLQRARAALRTDLTSARRLAPASD